MSPVGFIVYECEDHGQWTSDKNDYPDLCPAPLCNQPGFIIGRKAPAATPGPWACENHGSENCDPCSPPPGGRPPDADPTRDFKTTAERVAPEVIRVREEIDLAKAARQYAAQLAIRSRKLSDSLKNDMPQAISMPSANQLQEFAELVCHCSPGMLSRNAMILWLQFNLRETDDDRKKE